MLHMKPCISVIKIKDKTIKDFYNGDSINISNYLNTNLIEEIYSLDDKFYILGVGYYNYHNNDLMHDLQIGITGTSNKTEDISELWQETMVREVLEEVGLFIKPNKLDIKEKGKWTIGTINIDDSIISNNPALIFGIDESHYKGLHKVGILVYGTYDQLLTKMRLAIKMGSLDELPLYDNIGFVGILSVGCIKNMLRRYSSIGRLPPHNISTWAVV